MVKLPKRAELKTDELRWRLDLSTLPFDTTDDIEPLEEIIGQDRGMEAFRFGMDIDKPGYNVLVTGQPQFHDLIFVQARQIHIHCLFQNLLDIRT